MEAHARPQRALDCERLRGYVEPRGRLSSVDRTPKTKVDVAPLDKRIREKVNERLRGFEYRQQAREPLVRDLIAIITVFSARLHGLRSDRKVLQEAAWQKE